MKVKAHIRYKTNDNKIVPGVTTVLGLLSKPALVPWANKLGLAGIDVRSFVDDKAQIGTLGHLFVTDHLAGIKTDTTDYDANQIDLAQNCALSFFQWEKEHPVKNIFVERPLVSERYRFGGTLDIYANVDDKLELIDLKTGNGIYDEHIFQVAALKMLLNEHGFEIDRARIINIPRTENEAFIERIITQKELAVGWEIFLNCLSIYNLKKELKGA